MGGEIVRLLVRPHRAGPGLPGRHAAPARGGPGAAGPVARGDARLLRDDRPDLGAPGPDQVPADRRRPRPRPRLPRRRSPRSSTAATSSAAEIGEIKAMKRRIEQRTVSAGTAEVEVKTGHGGIRDVEFVVQFLQLLHGGAVPRGPPRQHPHGDLPARAGRLPHGRGARDHGGHLPLPPPGRAPAPDHVRPPDPPDAPRPRGAAHPGDPDGLPARQRLGGPDRARRSGSWPTTGPRPS